MKQENKKETTPKTKGEKNTSSSTTGGGFISGPEAVPAPVLQQSPPGQLKQAEWEVQPSRKRLVLVDGDPKRQNLPTPERVVQYTRIESSRLREVST